MAHKRWHANLTAAAVVAAVCGVVKVRPGEKFSHALRTLE